MSCTRARTLARRAIGGPDEAYGGEKRLRVNAEIGADALVDKHKSAHECLACTPPSRGIRTPSIPSSLMQKPP